MRDNGTDRDVALKLLDAVTTAAILVTTINQHLYVATITTQPTNQTGAIGDNAVFTIVADNVVAYQWQFKRPDSNWSNSTSSGYNTDTLTVEIQEARYGYYYRCRLTGKDGKYVFSDEVQIIPNS